MGNDLDKYANDLDIILALSRKMTGVHDLNVLLDLILGAAKDLTKSDRCSCFVVDPGSRELLTRVAQGAETIRLPRGVGIAGSVAESGEIINIADVYQDERFNPEHDRRSGYTTKSMLCMPLPGRENQVVGVLQMLNKEDGQAYDEYDERITHLLCSQAAVAIETAQLVAQDAERQRLVHDMELAQSIQGSLLPSEAPEFKNWKLAAWQKTCDATGGDYYDYLDLGHILDLVVGDVSGHGIGAAMYMSTARAFLRALHGPIDPGHLMGQVNDLLESDMSDDSFMTMIMVRIAIDGRMWYVSAGHEPPLVYRRATGTFDDLDETGMLLGALPGSTYEVVEVKPLESGDVAVLYTDGLFEAENANEEEWGLDAFKQAIVDSVGQGPEGMIGSVVGRARAWVGKGRIHDDWTMMVVERC